MEREFRYYPGLVEISEHAAQYVVDLAQQKVMENGAFTMVLSGGNTPRLLYENLALTRFSDCLPWSKTHVFWGDERCVPKGDSQSNYAMARETLLLKVPLPRENIYRMPGEIEPPENAATRYEKMLRKFFSNAQSVAEDCFPSFDLILLGMGSDGHTASLFPGDPAVEERKQWVVSVSGLTAKPPIPRITLTLPIINQARYVLFLVTGEEKERVFNAIRRDPEEASRLYPSARVRAKERLIWYTNYRG